VSTGHPTDADRERLAVPVVERVVTAIETGKPAAFSSVVASQCVCLAGGKRIEGKDAITSHLASVLPGAREVTRRQQHGAHAVLGWSGGMCTLEIRRSEIVFIALS
jgi:hypothetical protein